MENIEVGRKIAAIRKQKDLSIRELAKLSNVTPSLLSQLERGLSNPSLNTIKSISKALDVPLFTFFIENVSNKEMIVRKDKRKIVTFPNNNNVVFEMLSPESVTSVEFAIVKLNPNASASDYQMSHKSQELAYILEGKVKLSMNEEEFILEKGDSVTIPLGTNHKWENPFDEEAQLIFSINFN